MIIAQAVDLAGKSAGFLVGLDFRPVRWAGFHFFVIVHLHETLTPCCDRPFESELAGRLRRA